MIFVVNRFIYLYLDECNIVLLIILIIISSSSCRDNFGGFIGKSNVLFAHL